MSYRTRPTSRLAFAAFSSLLGLALLLTGSFRTSVAATPTAGTPAQATFERFKALAGRWQAQSTLGWSVEVTLEVIARGSVVMATSHFEEGRKMVTMYSMDGGNLVATHYCEARNQPHLIASEISPDAASVLFTFVDAGNLESRNQGHMDSAHFRFLDQDRFSSRWSWYQDREETLMEEIEYRRIP